MTPAADGIVMTIGHSNRSLEEFTDLLRESGVELLVDVRTHPGSRRLPHFSQDHLPGSLAELGIDYRHMPDLGGRRRLDRSAPDAWGGAWRNSSFRAYAQHVQSEAFQDALDELIAIAGSQLPCIMCSEAVPWRCHRWLVSDSLVAHGIEVQHVMGPGQRRLHVTSSFARVGEGGVVTYPGPESSAKLSLGPAPERR
jgi:uncharacterized protein (DUF488 family)